MSASLLGLPAINAELKPISAYLQRAEELKNQEPVVAYWCAYYAAQVGIGMKAKQTASRNLLLELLGTLEQMKNDLAGNEIMDIESASAAYVEEFALKVFTSADDEDRSGQATRATAKKFLAASNFLDTLNVFPQTEVADSSADKSRYAKWKAADIAKAFREGRKPTPGPPGGEEHEANIDNPNPLQGAPDDALRTPTNPKATSPLGPSPPHLKRDPPLPRLSPEQVSPPTEESLFVQDDATPGSWSTTATPGADFAPVSGAWKSSNRPLKTSSPLVPRQGQHSRNGSASSGKITVTPPKRLSPSLKSPTELDIDPSANANAAALGIDKRAVHFKPSLETGLNDSTESVTSAVTVQASAPPLSPPSRIQLSPPLAPEKEIEILTPALIAKVQKHCRFAISALDYEDAAQAKKELRAALAMLGG